VPIDRLGYHRRDGAFLLLAMLVEGADGVAVRGAMPFILIHGTFHLVGRTQAGNPTGFEPDGDSIQFQPANPALLDQLDQPARPYRLSSTGSTQLRLEAIDALELHFDSTHQPRPLADQARDFLTGKLGLNPVPYRPPKLLQVKPPSPQGRHPGVHPVAVA
jgi:hypothetical protein